MNNTTTAPYKRRYQGNYGTARPTTQYEKSEVHPIRAEIQKNIGSITFTATFEEDREAKEAFHNEALIAYKCVLSHEGKIIGIGRGLNVLSAENRYLSKSVKWAFSGALISAVSNAVKFPELGNNQAPDFGVNDIASAFMATDKQKNYIRELIASSVPEDEQEEWLAQVETMSKEDASEAIQMLKN